jgi:hypothetical protein
MRRPGCLRACWRPGWAGSSPPARKPARRRPQNGRCPDASRSRWSSSVRARCPVATGASSCRHGSRPAMPAAASTAKGPAANWRVWSTRFPAKPCMHCCRRAHASAGPRCASSPGSPSVTSRSARRGWRIAGTRRACSASDCCATRRVSSWRASNWRRPMPRADNCRRPMPCSMSRPRGCGPCRATRAPCGTPIGWACRPTTHRRRARMRRWRRRIRTVRNSPSCRRWRWRGPGASPTGSRCSIACAASTR